MLTKKEQAFPYSHSAVEAPSSEPVHIPSSMNVYLPLSGETMQGHFGLVWGEQLGHDTHLGRLLVANWVKADIPW